MRAGNGAAAAPPQRAMTEAQALQWAMSLQQQGKLAQAEDIYRQVLAQQPRQSDALHLLGLAFHQRGRHAQAIDLVRRAIDARPNFATYHSNLGVILRASGEPAAAREAYRVALRLMPDSAELHSNLAVIEQELGEAEAALRHGWLAIALDPDNAAARNNLSNLLRAQGRLFESVAQSKVAIRLAAKDADAWFNLGLTLEDLGEYRQAQLCHDTAIRLNPNHIAAQGNKALISLKLGDFAAGLIGFEWRRLSSDARRRRLGAAPSSARWAGQPIAGKTLLLLADSSQADAIMFSRYCLLAAKVSGARLIAECDPALRDLFAGIGSVAQWIDPYSPPPPHDFHLPLVSLPRILKTTAQTIPAPYAYLRPPADRVRQSDLRIGADLPAARKVGIVWAAEGRDQNHDPQSDRRNCPLSYFLQLLQVPDLQLIGLQRGAAAAQWQAVRAPTRMRDMGARCTDVADLAMVIAQLDLVIAVDGLVAHLAGALGKPVWLLLSRNADWRWQLDRADSPWYPSMRLFRQEHVGDWGGVFQRLIGQLRGA